MSKLDLVHADPYFLSERCPIRSVVERKLNFLPFQDTKLTDRLKADRETALTQFRELKKHSHDRFVSESLDSRVIVMKRENI